MIGLIAADGKLPLIFARAAKEKKLPVVCVAIVPLANSNLKKYVKKIYYERAENFSRIINIFKEEKIKEVVMLGKFYKENFFSRFNPDKRTLGILNSLKDKKDTTLVLGIINEFKKEGIRIVPATLYLKDLIAKKGILTKRKPAHNEMKDINFGFGIARKLADLDIGQTIVVKDKMVLAVESLEGTDETIKRGGAIGKGGAVCIKVARTNQDLRIDTPVIGPRTIKVLNKSKISSLVIESNKMLIIDEKEVIETADKEGISIISI